MRSNRKIARRMVLSLLYLPIVAAGCVLAPGCAYDASELQAFLIKPRSPVSGLEYRVYPPDSISISSLQVPEIGGGHLIRPDGKINLPMLGEIFITGMTPREIEETLAKAAKDFYEETDATVQVTGYNSQKFYVFGQVGRGGPVPWTGRDTLLDVLARAGPTNLAWQERIIVVRGLEPQVGGDENAESSGKYRRSGIHPAKVGEPRKKMLINLYAMTEEGDFTNNILLKPHDVIYVQPTPLASIGLALSRLLFPVSPVVSTFEAPARLAVGPTPLP